MASDNSLSHHTPTAPLLLTKQVVDAQVDNLNEMIDHVWVLIVVLMIMNMQVGFILLEVGLARFKNTRTILMKNLIDTFVSSVVFWLFGYAMSVNAQGGFFGAGPYFMRPEDDDYYLKWIVGFSFCNTASTIVSGSLAERTFLDTYLFFTVYMTAILFPTVSAWVWGGGWLSNLGFHDHAGSGVVHLVGGTCGLVGTAILGPRLGFSQNHKLDKFHHGRAEILKNIKKLHTMYQENDTLHVKLSNLEEKKHQEKHGTHRFFRSQNTLNRQQSFNYDPPQRTIGIIPFESNTNEYLRQRKKSIIAIDSSLFAQADGAVSPGEKYQFTNNTMAQQQLQPWNPPSLRYKNSSGKINSYDETARDKVDVTTFRGALITGTIPKRIEFFQNKIEKKNEAIDQLQSKVEQMQLKRYRDIRKSQPEFMGFSDREITIYIDLFDQNLMAKFEPHSITLAVSGCMILFCNWLFFNGGSSFSITQDKGTNDPISVILATLISASSATCSTLLMRPLLWMMSEGKFTVQFDLLSSAGALMAGCVSITACCDNVTLHSACLVGIIGGFLYMATTKLYKKIEIDDPIEASQIHGFCGLWGLCAVGLFDNDKGLFFSGSVNQLAIQVVGGVSIVLWTALLSGAFFGILKHMNRFRVGEIFEIVGQDILDPFNVDLVQKNTTTEMARFCSSLSLVKLELKQRRLNQQSFTKT